MPNHVENDLRVSGAKEALMKFKEFAKDKEDLLSADKFIPYPEEFKKADRLAKVYDEKRNKYFIKLKEEGKDTQLAWAKYPSKKDGYNSGGYDWCKKNWGTKWGMYDVKLEETHDEDRDELFYTFQSAWVPPIPIIKKMAEMFPTLDFDLRYFEQGSEFNGILRIEKNKVTREEEGKYFGDRGG